MSCIRGHHRDEQGAALELALIFLTACALIVAGLLSFASTGSSATLTTRTVRSTDYDADSAMQIAIATIRVGATQGYVGSCLPGGLPLPVGMLNNTSRPVRVDCSPFAAPSAQRHVVLSVCPTSVSAPCPDVKALLRADVIFYDSPAFGRSLSIQSWSNQ